MAEPDAQRLTDPSVGRGPVDRWFHDRYGGKQAFLRWLRCWFRRVRGGFSAERDVDFATVRRLVFVCVGNICRSPYGEALARARGLRCTSFGLAARTGDPANPNALAVAGERGVDLSSHRATAVDDFAARAGDLLLGCEPAHTGLLRARFGGREGVQVTLLGLYAAAPDAYLHDPYGLGPAYFRRCYAAIESAVDGLVERAAPAAFEDVGPGGGA